MSQPQVGVQLIIYGRRSGTDFAGVVREVAEVGYAGIEGGAPGSQEEVERVKAALSQAGLAFAGGHTGFGQLDDPARVKQMAKGVKALGGRYLVVSGGDWDSLDMYLGAAKTLNEAGRVCQGEGVTFCYHNHHWEFRDFGGTKGIHAMVEATDGDLVRLCPDVYWVHVGGEKPEEFIARYRDRCPYFHFKDGLGGDHARAFRELGRGSVDLAAALKAALACNPEWIVVEQDTTEIEPKESNRISRECLKSLGV